MNTKTEGLTAKQIAAGWMPHDGKDSPARIILDVLCRNGTTCTGQPQHFQWRHDAKTYPSDVVAWRINRENSVLPETIRTALSPGGVQITQEMIDAGAKAHDNWAGEGTIGALNAARNVKQILQAALPASTPSEGVSPGANAGETSSAAARQHAPEGEG